MVYGLLSLGVTGRRHLPEGLGVILLHTTLLHVELPPVLGSFLQGDDGPDLTVVDQVLKTDLGAPNKIIPGVSVLVVDLEVER